MFLQICTIPKRLVFILFNVFFTNIFCQTVTVPSGSVKRFNDFKSKYIAPRHVDVWLPKGYNSTLKYAVLYMHDGQMLFDSTQNLNHKEWCVDETMSHLIAEKKVKNCIIVAIHNTRARHADYYPQKPFENLPRSYRDSLLNYARQNPKTGLFPDKVQSDNYLKFIVLELKPFIDKQFSTLSNRKNTFIAGSSMGALISMYALCEYPSVFGGAACLSTHWIGTLEVTQRIPDTFMAYLKDCLPSPKTHKVYFDHGTTTLDAFYPSFQKQADAIMLSKGFNSKNWITRVFQCDDHSEKSWAKRLNIALVFLLGKK
jgi:predicted alpha/beta superfamily hydrolase